MSISKDHLKAVQPRTNIDQYVPSIAKEMRRQGINSFLDLWNKIKPHLESNPEFFQNVTYYKINNCVHGKQVQNPELRDYSRTAYAVAAGLNKSVEELFGELNFQTPETLNVKRYHALEVLGDGYDDRTLGPIATVFRNQLIKAVRNKIDGLPPRERDCLTRRFGLEGPEQTFDKVAQEWGGNTSREFVRVVQARAIRTMRKPSASRRLWQLSRDL